MDKLKKILLAQGDATPNIEVVFVLGEPIDEEGSNPERLKSSMAATANLSTMISAKVSGKVIGLGSPCWNRERSNL